MTGVNRLVVKGGKRHASLLCGLRKAEKVRFWSVAFLRVKHLSTDAISALFLYLWTDVDNNNMLFMLLKRKSLD